jgi:hypothetical protein
MLAARMPMVVVAGNEMVFPVICDCHNESAINKIVSYIRRVVPLASISQPRLVVSVVSGTLVVLLGYRIFPKDILPARTLLSSCTVACMFVEV